MSYSSISHRLLLAGVLGVLAALAVFSSTRLASAMLGLSLPWLEDITGGHVGLHVATSDILLVLIGARLLADALVMRRAGALSALRPVAFTLAQYAWVMALVLMFHLGGTSVLKSFQRLELFALPVLVGAYIGLRRQHMLVLRGYVLACTVLAIVWPILNASGAAGQLQKNPTAGFIASAIILLLAVRELRRFIWCLPILLVGVGLAESRGAILALAVGIATLMLMHTGARRRARVVAYVLAVGMVGTVVYLFLPSSATNRLTNFTPGTGSSSSYAITYREDYYKAAEHIIAAHPWVGVGVGNYVAGSAANLTLTTDPNNVVLLEAAEGGYLFAASFLLLILGTVYALWRMRRLPLAGAAAAVLVCTFTHGLVDIYWVRGTPVLGWLLVGMVCAQAWLARREATA